MALDSLELPFFLFDSLLAVWHNIYLARLLLLMSKHNQQKNPVQKKMAGIDPTQSKHNRLHFLLYFWRLPEIGGISAGVCGFLLLVLLFPSFAHFPVTVTFTVFFIIFSFSI